MNLARSTARQSFRLNFDSLSAPLRMRLQSLFKVAGAKSVVEWSTAAADQAELLVLESDAAGIPSTNAACIVWIAAAGQHFNNGNNRRLAQNLRQLTLNRDFTVAHLLDALDLAGVHLMQQRTMHQVKFANARSDAATYRLIRWPMLDSRFRNASYASALGGLSQQALSIEQIVAHSGLSLAQVEGLLSQLTEHGALNTAPSTSPAPSPVQTVAPAPNEGLISRLTSWLRRRGFASAHRPS